ncbi:helix-turn-helix transcriptional regulator [Vibrio gallicus]|uniref:helix-turn-helix transcriptional regulator n=1 Tax=Vibrio gallicus TaxID=190897 RepID=UPI0021C3B8CF|nr:response regulator transcription factor [Vibrio gallicus]
METRHLLILAEKSMQTGLLEQQVSTIPHLEVRVLLPVEAVFKSHNLLTDLVLIDYDYLIELERRALVPDFDMLDWPLLIHNVPCERYDQKLLRWKILKGLLLQTANLEHINESIEYIFEGGLWLPRPFMETLLRHYRTSGESETATHSELTFREKQVLELLAYGISNQKIASQLFLSESTVKSHIYKLYRKLGVHSRQDAIKYARRNGY